MTIGLKATGKLVNILHKPADTTHKSNGQTTTFHCTLYNIPYIIHVSTERFKASSELNITLFWDSRDVLPMLKRNLLPSFFGGK
jgi:hypothetical protein